LARYNAGAERFTAAMGVCPDLRLVAHSDLGAGNTLTAAGRISGIIDWGNAVVGDPLYDIAHLTFWAPWHHGCPEELLRRSAAEVFGDVDFAERVRAYELHISLAAQRFNAAMDRTHLLGPIAERAEHLTKGE
jgi:hygromycin-B 4-O-kinase